MALSTVDTQKNNTPEFSILIGLVSTEDETRVLQCLAALREQKSGIHYEVIIADRRNCSISKKIKTQYPEVRLLPCDKTMSLPQLRTVALRQATGKYIVVTEDHCVPGRAWLSSFQMIFATAPSNVVAVGGAVENGTVETALDWATFLCEYSFFLPPVDEELTAVIPGMNTAYKRQVFEKIDDNFLNSSFWEFSLHPLLLQNGGQFILSNSAKIAHSKKFSFSWFVQQRFIYSCYFAGARFKKSQYVKRVAATLMSLTLLPPLLLFRILEGKRDYWREMLRALPYLTVFVCVWAAGEARGYLFGAGDALNKIE